MIKRTALTVYLCLLPWALCAQTHDFPATGANRTLTVLDTLAQVDNTVYLDAASCSDVGLNQAIAAALAVPSGRKIVDASACDAGTSTVATTVNLGKLGAGAIGIQLRLNSGTLWRCTITNSTPCWVMPTGSSITCPGATKFSFCALTVASTAHISSLIKADTTAPVGFPTSHLRIDGTSVQNYEGGTVNDALIDWGGVYDSGMMEVTLGHCPYSRCLWIHDLGATVGANSLDLSHLLIDNVYRPGGRPVVIESNFACSGGGGISQVGFDGGDWGHPGGGNFIVEINGHNHPGCLIGVHLTRQHLEGSTVDTTTDLVHVVDTRDVSFEDETIYKLAERSTAFNYGISETAAGNTNQVSLRDIWGSTISPCNMVNAAGFPPAINTRYTDTTNCNESQFEFFNSESNSDHVQIGGVVFNSDGSYSVLGSVNGSVKHAVPAMAGSGTITDPPATTGTTEVVIGSGSIALSTGALKAAGCEKTITVPVTGATSETRITWNYATSPSTIAGYGAAPVDAIHILAWPTSGNVNFQQCSSVAVIPGAISIRWSALSN
jgi:hypothetical protein